MFTGLLITVLGTLSGAVSQLPTTAVAPDKYRLQLSLFEGVANGKPRLLTQVTMDVFDGLAASYKSGNEKNVDNDLIETGNSISIIVASDAKDTVHVNLSLNMSEDLDASSNSSLIIARCIKLHTCVKLGTTRKFLLAGSDALGFKGYMELTIQKP